MPEVPAESATPSYQKSKNGKRPLLAVLIVAFLVGIGVLFFLIFQPKPKTTQTTTSETITATASAKNDETAGWKVYTSEFLGISVKYPQNWGFKDDLGPVNFAENPNAIQLPILISISRYYKDSDTDLAYDEDVKTAVNVPNHSTASFGVEVTKTRLPDVIIDSNTWIKVKTTVGQDDTLDNSIKLVSEKDGYYYEIVLETGKSAELESHSKLFDLLASSFRFKKSNWVDYTNKDLGFSLRIPSNFKVTNDLISFSGPTQKQGAAFHDGLFISFSTLNRVDKSISSLRNTAEAEMKKFLPSGTIGSGNGTYYADLTSPDAGTPMRYIYTELDEDRILKIQAIHGGEKDKEHLILLNKILLTFRLLD